MGVSSFEAMTEFSPSTFYATTSRTSPDRQSLASDIETDVCVIGGGFAGLWAARALLAHGREVVLLERRDVAGAASGQNGGFVSAGYAERLEKIVARVGLDYARELYKLSREGVEIVRGMLAKGDLDDDVKAGRLNVLRYSDEVGLIDQADMLARDFNHDVVLWSQERVQNALRSDRYYQALHETDAFHLNPLNLARALASDIEAHGGRIYEHSAVVQADLEGLRKSIHTSKGRIRAFNVVIAGNAFLHEFFPELANTVLPVRSHVAVTEPIGDILSEVIRYQGAIADTRRAGNYYRIVGDRLLWGGRITTNTKPPRNLGRMMGRDIASVYPQLAGVQIDYAWSGTMGYAIHKMPQIGMVQPGVWISSAFGGHGLNTTAIAGELIASAIVEQDDRWRLYIPFGLVWAGGAAGRAATQVSYWLMQIKDRLDEAQAKRTERVEADVAAGLSPSLSARTARRAKRKFMQGWAGRASTHIIHGTKKFAAHVFLGLSWVGDRIYQISAVVGRALVAIIWFVASIMGFVARQIGRGMELVAAYLFAFARVITKAVMFVWRNVLVPAGRQSTRLVRAMHAYLVWAWMRTKEGGAYGAKWVTAFAAMVWVHHIIPTSKRFSKKANFAGTRAKARNIKFLKNAHERSLAFGERKNEIHDSEMEPSASAQQLETPDEPSKPKKKKKKAKEKENSVEL